MSKEEVGHQKASDPALRMNVDSELVPRQKQVSLASCTGFWEHPGFKTTIFLWKPRVKLDFWWTAALKRGKTWER